MANTERPSFTYHVKNGRIMTMTDGHKAMVQAVDKILRTERFVYPVYDDQYGNDFFELFGKSFDYAEAEVERMIKECLLADDRITNVAVDVIKQVDSTTLYVHGSCETIFGPIPIESEVRVHDAGTTGSTN